MDTSPEYIKMCEKAEEIQQMYDEWPNGSFWWDGDMIVLQTGRMCDHPAEGDIWLPRQDQLQEMARLPCSFPAQILYFLMGWIKGNNILPSNYGSMEQLWLAFVMGEKCGKRWNGEEWEAR